jgi:hypothetical protein
MMSTRLLSNKEKEIVAKYLGDEGLKATEARRTPPISAFVTVPGTMRKD